MAGKYNVKIQYAAWVATITLGTVVILTTVHMFRDLQVQEAAIRARALVIGRVLARAVAPGVEQGNAFAVERAVAQSVAEEELLYLRILDRKGQVVFRPPQNREPNGLVMAEVSILSGETEIGQVELGMDRGSMAGPMMQTVAWNIGVGAVLLLVFVGGSFLVSAPVRTALRDLHDYIKRVSAGLAHGERLDSDLAEVDEVAKELTDVMRRVEEAQAKLQRAQKELKATQKEMDEYTYVISHDLKEPLRGIEAFSKFLADGYRHKLDEDGQHQLDVIRNSALRMQRLITDLLKFSRLSQQKKPMEVVGLNAMLMHVRVNLQFALDSKKADLRVNKLPTVVCDATAMTEVFHNLISNAIKYNNNAHPVVEVSASERANPDTGEFEHVFSVRDNGMGIKQEYFDKIFQIFQRLERDEKSEGTGIGLTIVRRVVEWHGGRIWLESEEGKGTTFHFTLPKREVTKMGTIVDQPLPPMKGELPLATTV